VTYSRRIRNATGELVEVGLSQGFSHWVAYDRAFEQVREQVEKWLAEEDTKVVVIKENQKGYKNFQK
jgi:hypothetical protein